MIYLRSLLVLAVAMSLSSLANAAEVVYWGNCPGLNVVECGPGGIYSQHRINVIGPIEEGDLEKIEIALASARLRPSNISISSPGGSVIEAMKIGRFLRDSMIGVVVPGKAECVSACFLIVVGATKRYVRAPVGIHRAYFSGKEFASLSPVEADRHYRALDRFVRDYLEEMYVPEEVVAQMMATKSTTETYLGREEFRESIGWVSPAIEEWLIAKCGELTREDWFDLRAIGCRLQREENLTSVNDLAPTGNIEDETPEEQAYLRELFELSKLDEEEMQMAAYADTLSAEYRDRLTKKQVEYAICTNTAEGQHQDEVIAALKAKHNIE